MMIDDIVLTERLVNNTGLEDTAIKLLAISARLKDEDGSETLTLTVEAIPVGATLTDGINRFTATIANISTWNLSNLSLTPPQDFNGTINLQVKATATERSDSSYIYTPRRNYTGTDSFTYTVNDGTSCVQATISLVVQNQSNDDDNCHRQSITIQSVYANNTANNTPSYVVINNNATNTSPSSSVVNWDIFAPQVGITLQPQVLTQHNTEANNLAVLTGLVVKKV